MTTANMATAAALPRAHVSVPQAGVATFVTSHVIKVSGEKSARRCAPVSMGVSATTSLGSTGVPRDSTATSSNLTCLVLANILSAVSLVVPFCRL
ncbi:uncharacterized protein LOC135103149 isoform X2 [Scylla paramamosain]|uniref:uncharacterized protein LOC135103149 isoform X2 n=1 Tax=Scylla paramamosain TaxID=85552 RepID=UPI003082A5E4